MLLRFGKQLPTFTQLYWIEQTGKQVRAREHCSSFPKINYNVTFARRLQKNIQRTIYHMKTNRVQL